MALKLQGYSFNIEHRSGKDNLVPDALSRNSDENYVTELSTDTLPAIDLESEAFESNEYKKIRKKFESAQLPDYMVVDENTQFKLIVPESLREDVIISNHNPPTTGHSDIAKTLNRIRRYFYWPGMVADVRKFVLDCEYCQTSKIPNQNLRPLMGQMTESQRPFQKLYVDLIGPFPRSKKGNIGIFIVLDHFSKFTFFKTVKEILF